MTISHDDEDFAPLITEDMPSSSPPAENNRRKKYFNMVFCLAFGVVFFMVAKSSKFFHLAVQKETLYTNASIDGSDDANDDRKQNQTKSSTAKLWEEPQVKATRKLTRVTEVIPESMNANPSPEPTLVAPKPKPWTTDRTWEDAVAEIVGSTPVYNSSQANHPNCARLCKHLRETFHAKRQTDSPLLVYNDSHVSCRNMANGFGGIGNGVLEDFGGKRLAAWAEGNTSIIMDCGADAFVERDVNVYPWLSGYFPALATTVLSRDKTDTPLVFRDDKDQHFELPTNMSNSKLCLSPTRRRLNDVHISDMRIISEEGRHHQGHRILNPGDSLPLKLMNPWMNHDLRRMAIAIVGVHPTNSNHASHTFAEKYLLPESKLPPFSPTPATGSIYRIPIHEYYQNGPLHPNTQLDDVVIHYRCGDVLLGAYGPFYYPKYEEYVKYISPEVKSIGIVTQPFANGDNVQARHRDHVEKSGELCKYLVEGLIDYLKTHLYNKEIEYNIHNGPGETVAMAYTRLIMANQTFGLIPSTFSTFPVIASFGTGYLTGSKRIAGSFINNPITEGIYPNQPVKVGDTKNMLYCQTLKKMWEKEGKESVLKWMTSATEEWVVQT